MLASLVLVFTRGLNFGIDFSGGILIEARMSEKVEVSVIRSLIAAEVEDVSIQNLDGKDLLIRVPAIKTSKDSQSDAQSRLVKNIQDILTKTFPDIEYRKIDYVGPQIGAELIQKGFLALFLSFIFIMIYIWIRFDWQFSLGGIFALMHDAILTLGFFSVTGLEFNTTSIAAILTIIGYSINDSVVIYDRIRENLRRYKKAELPGLIDSSLNSTLSRTVLTSGVTLFSLLAIMLYGGDALFSFSCAAFFGIAVGTYSSIYISVPLLIYCDPRKAEEERKLASE